MAISFCVLGSGSGGNCTLLRLREGDATWHVLIDAGLSPRRTAARLGSLGVAPEDVGDVLLTHLDTDHLHGGWINADDPPPFTWRAHRRHLRAVLRTGIPAERLRPFEDRFELDGGTVVETTLLPHDRLGSTAFVIEHREARLGFATDMGRATATLLDRFARLDAVAIESNYDTALQLASPRPVSLKQRITGGLGHLSNDQSLEAVLRIDRAGTLRHVVLLHLSRQCNDPRIVCRLYAERAPHLLGRLTVTSQHRPTPMLHVTPGPAPVMVGQQMSFLE